ncbi:MAG: hypothetical protein FDZ70_08345, partial [Actinobacteria bacterium]
MPDAPSADRRTARAESLALIGVALLALVAPLVPGRVTLGPLALDSVILGVPAALLLAWPLMRALGLRRLPRLGAAAPAIVFLGWLLLSCVANRNGVGGLMTWLRYAMYVAFAAAVATVALDARRRLALMWVFALTGSLNAVHGVYQYFNPSEQIGLAGLSEDVATRVFSTFENPNFFAEFLVLVFAVTLALAFASRGRARFWAVMMLGVQTLALLLTYTRGSWLALAAGLAVAVLMVDAKLVVPFIAGGVVMVPVVPGALDRVLSIFSLEGTAAFRMQLWQVAGTVIGEDPLFGFGPGDFYLAFKSAVLAHPELRPGYLIYGAHNSYFQIGAEAGVVAMLAFLMLVFTACRMGLFYSVRAGEDRSGRLQNAALTAGLIAFGINALTSNSFQHPRAAVFFFLLMGLQAGLGAAWWDRVPAPVATPG